MTATRAELAKGVFFTEVGKVFRWKDSYIDIDEIRFAPLGFNRRSTHRPRDNRAVQPDSLYIIGNRQFYPDAPIYIDGVEMIRFDESDSAIDRSKDNSKTTHFLDGEALEKAERAFLRDMLHVERNDKETVKKELMEKVGFHRMSVEARKKYAAMVDVELAEEDLEQDNQRLNGVIAVLVGGFGDKEKLRLFLEDNGAKVYLDVPKSKTIQLTHLVLGSSSITQYGQKSGKGSKKYNAAVKANALEVGPTYFKDLIDANNDWREEYNIWWSKVERKEQAKAAKQKEAKAKRDEERKRKAAQAKKDKEEAAKKIREEAAAEAAPDQTGPRRSKRRRT